MRINQNFNKNWSEGTKRVTGGMILTNAATCDIIKTQNKGDAKMFVYEHKYDGRVLKGVEFFNEHTAILYQYVYDDKHLTECLNSMGYTLADVFHMEEIEKNHIWSDFISDAIKIIDWRLQNGYTDWIRKEIEEGVNIK